MLNTDDELKMLSCLDVARNDFNEGFNYGSSLHPQTILWLAEKCKELQNELKEKKSRTCSMQYS